MLFYLNCGMNECMHLVLVHVNELGNERDSGSDIVNGKLTTFYTARF